jgi:hypothetical protein
MKTLRGSVLVACLSVLGLVNVVVAQFPSPPVRFVGEGRIITRNASVSNTAECYSSPECAPLVGCITDDFHWTIDENRCGSFVGAVTGETFNGWDGQWLHQLSTAKGQCGLGIGGQVVCGEELIVSAPYWFEVRPIPFLSLPSLSRGIVRDPSVRHCVDNPRIGIAAGVLANCQNYSQGSLGTKGEEWEVNTYLSWGQRTWNAKGDPVWGGPRWDVFTSETWFTEGQPSKGKDVRIWNWRDSDRPQGAGDVKLDFKAHRIALLWNSAFKFEGW